MFKILTVIFIAFCFVESQQLHDPDSWRQSEPADESVHHSPDITFEYTGSKSENENVLHTPDIVFEYTKSKLENGYNDTISWFYKKLVMIILKKGITKENEDKTLDVTLHFKFSEEQWQALFEMASSSGVLTDAKLRRSDGYISEAVYTAPYLVELASTWTQVTLQFLTDYKMPILCTLLILLVLYVITIAVKHLPFKAVALTTFLLILYAWEMVISYKEYEQHEYEKLVSAIYYCRWQFWTQECNYPMPDDLQFYRYMNPVKIIPRIVTQIFTEPLIHFCIAMETVCDNLSRNFMWPFSSIAYFGFIVTFVIIIVQMFILLIGTFIFNVPSSSSFLYIFNISFGQRKRSLNDDGNTKTSKNQICSHSDRDQISGGNVEKLLSIANLALKEQANLQQQIQKATKNKLQKSNSVGRLCDSAEGNNILEEPSTSNAKKKKPNKTKFEVGNGDSKL